MKPRIYRLCILLALTLTACAAHPSPMPTVAAESVAPPGLPQTEAEVPRVTVEEALAALQTGVALIVDVRSPQSFAAGHIEGAVNIPLTQIEADPSGLPLDKNLWIIAYCA